MIRCCSSGLFGSPSGKPSLYGTNNSRAHGRLNRYALASSGVGSWKTLFGGRRRYAELSCGKDSDRSSGRKLRWGVAECLSVRPRQPIPAKRFDQTTGGKQRHQTACGGSDRRPQQLTSIACRCTLANTKPQSISNGITNSAGLPVIKTHPKKSTSSPK
jgi:hypothetical protein